MRDKKSLLQRHRRKFPDQTFRLVYVTADTDQSGEQVRIAQAGFDRHQTALGKAEQCRLIRGPAMLALCVQQLEQQRAAPFHAGPRVAGKVKPRVTAKIQVGRVDQQVIHPRQPQRGRQPAISLQTVAQAVQDDHQAA